MKKLIGIVLSVVLAFGCMGMLAGCGDRSKKLKLLSQGEYMDETIFEGFSEWYNKETGNTVEIEITMDDSESNEDMLRKFELGSEDYDLVCISDYMVEKFIAKDLVKPLKKDIIDVNDYIMPEYIEHSKLVDPELKYSVPFMFGTLGLMYNYDKTEKNLTSITSLYSNEFGKEVFTKASVRDTYSAACIYASLDQSISGRPSLSSISDGFNPEKTSTPEYKAAMQSIFEDTSAAMLEKAEVALKKQKENVKQYDAETGKTAMLNNSGTLGLFWSCDAGYVMNDNQEEGFNGNKDLWYVIPDEGGSIYVDSFVMPKSAKGNEDVINYFLKYLCQEDIAIANSEYIGAISPVKSAYETLYEDFNSQKLGDKDSVFEKAKSEEWRTMYLEMMFPSVETISRCGIMRDYKSREQEIISKTLAIIGSV